MPNISTLNIQSHISWDCSYHIVIVPKYRKKILFDLFREQAREILRELSKQKGMEITEGNVCPDHVHLVISIPPRLSVANAMGFLKEKSAIRLLEHPGA